MKFALMVSAVLASAAAEAFTPTEWTKFIPPDGLKATVFSNGVELVLAGRGRRKGGDGFVAAQIPLYVRGRLDFDVKVEPPTRNRAMAQFMTFYGIRMFWHDSCRDWRVIIPGPNSERESGFADEPVRHFRIGKFAAGEWHHCRVCFDAESDRVEFFLDDMSDPAYIAGGVSVWDQAEYEGGVLKIGGLGLSRDSVGTFANIELEEESGAAAGAERTGTLVFDGLASDYYRAADLLAAEKPRHYVLDFTRASYWPKNNYKYVKLPGRETLAAAKRIVLVDAPFQFDDVLPPFVVADIAAAVNDGAELVVLDGPFALDRGGYGESALAKILPDGSLSGSPFQAPPGGPQILERSVGKGSVKVFRGLAFGSDRDDFRRRFAPWAERLFGKGK